MFSSLLSPHSFAAAQPVTNTEHRDLSFYRDGTVKKRPVGTTADWERRKQAILRNMQTVMGPLPRPKTPVALDLKTLESKMLPFSFKTANGQTRTAYLNRKLISYHTDSTQRRVRAYLFLPRKSEKKLPAVLCLHQTTGIGKGEPAGLGGKPNLQYALHLAHRGYITLAPNYPSFGDDKYAFPKKDGYISGTMKAIYDNIRAVDLLTSLPEVDAKRIGCIGHSLGGHNTMFTAAFEQRIKVMVSNCGFTRFHKYKGGKLKGWTSSRYMPLINSKYGNDANRVPFDFPEIIGTFAPRPFLASSPLHDSNFEASGVKDSIARAAPVYRLFEKPGNLQANYPDCKHDSPPNVRKVAYEFLDKHLTHTPLTREVK